MEAGGRVFGFFDEQILADNGTPDLPTFKPHPSGALRPVAFWKTDTIRRCIDAGSIVRADSLQELFALLDLPVAPTGGAVRRYNESASLGRDRDLGKRPGSVRSPRESPLLRRRVAPRGHRGNQLRGADRRVRSGARREPGADRGIVRRR